jgi:PilZ domain
MNNTAESATANSAEAGPLESRRRNETPDLRIGMGGVSCGWGGCINGAEVTLGERPLCRNHFYEIAAKRLQEHPARLQRIDLTGGNRIAITNSLSEIISQTTILVASAKLLAPWQRDQFLELSLCAVELYKRVQRNPRVPRNLPIFIYGETDSIGSQELTNTVNVSKRGACIATIRLWKTGEKIWIQKSGNQLRTLARVAWVKKNGPSRFLMGLEILDYEDFWGLEPASPVQKNS